MSSWSGVSRVFAIVFVLMLVPKATFAQNPSVPRGDVFGGVTFFNEDGFTFTGAQFSGAFRANRHVGVVGDIAFYEGRTTYMGGVRVYGRASKVEVFGQLLVGSAPLDDFAFQPGFSIDVRISSHAAVRAAFDIKVSGDEGVYVGSRFSTGVVIYLGRR
jgi:hypothetical protein